MRETVKGQTGKSKAGAHKPGDSVAKSAVAAGDVPCAVLAMLRWALDVAVLTKVVYDDSRDPRE
jgi:hypothetical protein